MPLLRTPFPIEREYQPSKPVRFPYSSMYQLLSQEGTQNQLNFRDGILQGRISMPSPATGVSYVLRYNLSTERAGLHLEQHLDQPEVIMTPQQEGGRAMLILLNLALQQNPTIQSQAAVKHMLESSLNSLSAGIPQLTSVEQRDKGRFLFSQDDGRKYAMRISNGHIEIRDIRDTRNKRDWQYDMQQGKWKIVRDGIWGDPTHEELATLLIGVIDMIRLLPNQRRNKAVTQLRTALEYPFGSYQDIADLSTQMYVA